MDRIALVVVSLLASSASLAAGRPELDFGDAPDPTYASLSASDGARHDRASGGAFLGALVDVELDGFPSVAADGDDLNGLDDEDGVVFASELLQGEMAFVDVSATAAALLDAWIDFNADGDWHDAGEQIFFSQPILAGVNPMAFSVPVAAVSGGTYARFRCSSTGNLGPEGYAADGEVEDYSIVVPEPATRSLGPAALLALALLVRRRHGA